MDLWANILPHSFKLIPSFLYGTQNYRAVSSDGRKGSNISPNCSARETNINTKEVILRINKIMLDCFGKNIDFMFMVLFKYGPSLGSS